MGKFKSWIHGSPSTSSRSASVDDKKANRRSISGFAFKHKPGDESVTTKEQRSSPAPEKQLGATGDSRILELAKTITAEAESLDAYLKTQGIAAPSFDPSSSNDFPKLPDNVQGSRQQILHAADELASLVRGPRESVRWGVWGFLDTLSLQIINNYGIAKLVPTDGEISFAELEEKTPLDRINLTRSMRHAMTNNIFRESKPGHVVHTSLSRLLAEDVALQDWVGFNSEDIFPAAANVLKAMKEHPEATSLTQTGFNFAFDTVDKEPMFLTFGKDPKRAKRMGGAMASLTGGEGYEVAHFVDNYDLSDVDKCSGTFVDIGGSHGFVSVDLAKKWKNINFIVQDLPKTVDSAPDPICSDESAAARIQLQAHDFFKEQSVKDADVYFFRWIIHNYSTPYAVSILKNLVPALKPGARIVINDHCLPEPGSESAWDDKLMRSMDMVMLALLNAQERDEAEFRQLFAQADPRFRFKSVTRTAGCRMSVVEAIWDPKGHTGPE